MYRVRRSLKSLNQHGYRCRKCSPDYQLLVQLRPVLHRQRPFPQDVEEVDLLLVLSALVRTLEGPRWEHRGETVKHVLHEASNPKPVNVRECGLFVDDRPQKATSPTPDDWQKITNNSYLP